MKKESLLKKISYLLFSLFVVFIDQFSKYLALNFLQPYQPEAVLPFLNLTLAYNTGAAFSFLQNSGDWHQIFFLFFSLMMSSILIIWLLFFTPKNRLQIVALSLVLGGALGNLYDRIQFGHVVDFISLYYKHFYWPVFNLADAAISVGAFLLFLDLIRERPR